MRYETPIFFAKHQTSLQKLRLICILLTNTGNLCGVGRFTSPLYGNPIGVRIIITVPQNNAARSISIYDCLDKSENKGI